MKIVQFEDGRYAIRKGIFSWTYEFLDLHDRQYWWSDKNKLYYYDHITSVDLEYIKQVYLKLNSNGRPIKM